MLSRFGLPIVVAWSERELLYLDALVEMGMKTQHIIDMSSLTGRSVLAILAQARKRKSKPIKQNPVWVAKRRALAKRKRAHKESMIERLAKMGAL